MDFVYDSLGADIHIWNMGFSVFSCIKIWVLIFPTWCIELSVFNTRLSGGQVSYTIYGIFYNSILTSTCQFFYINMEFSVCHIWPCRQSSPIWKYACDFPVWIMELSIFHIWKSGWIFFPTRNVEISIFHVTIWEQIFLYKKWKSLYFNALPSKPPVDLNDSKTYKSF